MVHRGYASHLVATKQPSSTRPTLDLPTVAAIALVAAIVNVVQHEGTHALACLLVGGDLLEFSALYVLCAAPGDAAARVVAGAAPAADLAIAGALWAWLWRGGPRGTAARLLAYLIMLTSALAGTGYFMVSGIAGFGDIAVVIDGWTPAWAWRTGAALVGSVLFLGAVWAALHVLGQVLGGSEGDGPERSRRAQRVGVTAYASAVVATLAAAAVSPLGLGSLPSVAGMIAVVFGYSPLLWMGLWFSDSAFAKPPAQGGIARDPRWWLTATVAAAAFVGVLGPTITFA